MTANRKYIEKVSIADARVIFRNLSGKIGEYNASGDRTFGVILDRDTALRLEEAGWYVRWLKPREEGEDETPWIKVKVNYKEDREPPKIVMITNNKVLITENTVHMLDYADIESVDVVFVPYHWTVNKKNGVTAYLESMYVTIRQDEFEGKYDHIPYANEPPPFV